MLDVVLLQDVLICLVYSIRLFNQACYNKTPPMEPRPTINFISQYQTKDEISTSTGHLHDDIIYYYDRDPSGFSFLLQITAFVI